MSAKLLFVTVISWFLCLFSLEAQVAPGYVLSANDFFKDRIRLYGTSIETKGDNISATTEPGDVYEDYPTARTVWWTWTAPVDGRVTIDTSKSNFFSYIYIFFGDTIDTLSYYLNKRNTIIAGTTITFDVLKGETYQIEVAGGLFYYVTDPTNIFSASGQITLTIKMKLNPPVNDFFNNSEVIPNSGATYNITNIGATREFGEPTHAGKPGGESLWYKWVAPRTGKVKIKSSSSTMDTILGVYIGSSVSALYDATTDTNGGVINSNPSALSFKVLAGETYNIAVDGFEGRVGDIKLSLAQGPTADLNGYYDYGSIPIKSERGRLLTITNNGTTTLRVRGLNLPAGFYCNYKGSIPVNSSKTIRVVFKPKIAGYYSGNITLKSNSVGTSPASISGTAF
jgi:hypothetical protein